MSAASEPDQDCPLCPRLHDFIASWREREPSWFNAPVPTFLPPEGPDSVRLLIVGLAPGLRGANRTGRPFTGDYAGDLLYRTLIRFGFAQGVYQARPDDGLMLVGTAITNAVRCVPPENKPLPVEINTCRQFLIPTIASFPNLKVDRDAWRDRPPVDGQGARRPAGRPSVQAWCATRHRQLTICPSYHCSRYNTNTGVLTEEMFVNVFSGVRSIVDK